MKYRRLILQLEAPADLVNRMEIEAKVLGISIGELVVQMIKAGYRVGSIRKQVVTVTTRR